MGIPVGLIESVGAVGTIAAFDAIIKSTNIDRKGLRAYTMEGDRILLTIEGNPSFLGEIETAVDHAIDAIHDVQGSEIISHKVLSNIETADWDQIKDALRRHAGGAHMTFSLNYTEVKVNFAGSIPAGEFAVSAGEEFRGAREGDNIVVKVLEVEKPNQNVLFFAFVPVADEVMLAAANHGGRAHTLGDVRALLFR